VIGYETKLQYPFPKEYGYLEDAEHIELHGDVNYHKVSELQVEYKDISANKPYEFGNVSTIMAWYETLYMINRIYLKDSGDAKHIDIWITKTSTADWKDEYKSRVVPSETYRPGGGVYASRGHGTFSEIICTHGHAYTITSDFGFLKSLHNALDRKEISVFHISLFGDTERHANAIVVHPHLSSIYYIEPHGIGRVIYPIIDKLKLITDQHYRRWDWSFNNQIQSEDPYCVLWVRLCITMIITNPRCNGIGLITSLLSNIDDSPRYTILRLWIFYLRNNLMRGDRTVEYYTNIDNKSSVKSEYKEYYSHFTDDEIEKRYNYDMPYMKRVLEILNMDSPTDDNTEREYWATKTLSS